MSSVIFLQYVFWNYVIKFWSYEYVFLIYTNYLISLSKQSEAIVFKCNFKCFSSLDFCISNKEARHCSTEVSMVLGYIQRFWRLLLCVLCVRQVFKLKFENVNNSHVCIFRVGGQNRFKTLRLPDISFENSSFSGIFLTNNSIDAVQYPKNLGPFSPVYLQISNFLL